jgi:hypothetical protein
MAGVVINLFFLAKSPLAHHRSDIGPDLMLNRRCITPPQPDFARAFFNVDLVGEGEFGGKNPNSFMLIEGNSPKRVADNGFSLEADNEDEDHQRVPISG